MDYLHRITTYLTELFWPAHCAGCNRVGAFACAACLRKLTLPAPRRYPVFTDLDRLIAATSLTDTAQSFVYALKYRGVQSLAAPLADRICDLINLRPDTATLFGSNPIIIPVPLHGTRLRERGFNQAELLARRIATNAAMLLDTTSLIRTRPTGQQAKQAGRAARRDNMEGAFAVLNSAAVANRDIVLIDDVCTTGATLQDCARALKESGARSVSAIVLAHG